MKIVSKKVIKNNKIKKLKVVICALLFLTLFNLSNNFILNEVNAEERSIEISKVIINEDNIKNFMDNYFHEKMKDYSVPGASVVVVKDNKEIFKSGYGYSNLESKTKVDIDKTSFPACSVSKLFTATAILQLYEKGELDLDRNIEEYISPYKVINKYDTPVTCRNLLTHSSGIDEESELNVATLDYNLVKKQEYYFNTHPIKVVTEPNTICRYSNIGYNILGYIVEKVSKTSYEDYVKENILKPLEMNDSTIRLKSNDTAKGYTDEGNKYIENTLAYQYTSGSCGIITTTKDMENFIIANLNNGKFKDNKILSDKTLKIMQDKQFSNSEVIPGMGFGFIRSYRNGEEIIKHEGALPSGYTTTLFILPKENIGIYIATNSLNALPFNFEEEFLNHFYPKVNNSFNTKNISKRINLNEYEGTYRNYDGTSKTNIMKLNVLFDSSMDMKIKDNKDGTLTLCEFTSAKEKIITKLVETEEGVFLREDGRGKVAFRFDKSGNVIYAFNDTSHNSFEKIKFYDKSQFIVSIIGVSLIIFITNLLIFIKSFLKRKKELKSNGFKVIKSMKLLNVIIEIFNITGALGVIILTVTMCLNSDFSLIYLLYFFLTLLIISNIMTFLSLILLIYSLFKNKGSIRVKVHYIILNIANLAFVWVLYYFNFLGYRLY